MWKKNTMILGEDCYYSMDCYKTKRNNNVLVVGAAGSGKTRSIVSPNILQATGSYVISDPKGNLYNQYKSYLEAQGYEVKQLNFIHPEQSIKYNFFNYIHSEQDIIKIAHVLSSVVGKEAIKGDPFWDDCSELLLGAIIGYLYIMRPKKEQTLESILKLVAACNIEENDSSSKSILDRIMDDAGNLQPNVFFYKQYKKFRIAAGKTLRSILITINSKLGKYDFDNLNKMLSKDETNITDIGKKKTAFFVIVSDKDRSLDGLANLFYTQAMEELCKYADDKCEDNRLPVDVRFILDDFATNCIIADFPQMISSIRSRGISTMLMLQAEGQLEACYPKQGNVVIGNCDTYVYLGGNDIETSQSVSIRCDVPMTEVLNMPLETNWIMRRGEKPIRVKQFDIDSYWKIRKEAEGIAER